MSFELFSRRVEKRTNRLARWKATASTEADFARIDRLEAKLAKSQARLDAITGKTLAAPTFEESQDKFTFEIEVLPFFPRINVSIVDSATDDSFTPGETLKLSAYAHTDPEVCKPQRGYTSNVTLPTEELAEQTVSHGDSLWNKWPEYDLLYLQLRNSNGDVVAGQTFETTAIFA